MTGCRRRFRNRDSEVSGDGCYGCEGGVKGALVFLVRHETPASGRQRLGWVTTEGAHTRQGRGQCFRRAGKLAKHSPTSETPAAGGLVRTHTRFMTLC